MKTRKPMTKGYKWYTPKGFMTGADIQRTFKVTQHSFDRYIKDRLTPYDFSGSVNYTGNGRKIYKASDVEDVMSRFNKEHEKSSCTSTTLQLSIETKLQALVSELVKYITCEVRKEIGNEKRDNEVSNDTPLSAKESLPEMLTSGQASEILGVSKTGLYYITRFAGLPFVWKHNQKFYKLSDINAFKEHTLDTKQDNNDEQLNEDNEQQL